MKVSCSLDGAKAGILFPASPDPGQVIRQEISWGDAEDVVEILSVTATESAPGGACVENCLLTADYTPLDPDVVENKYYAPGIGLIVEVDLETGDRVGTVLQRLARSPLQGRDALIRATRCTSNLPGLERLRVVRPVF